MPNTDYFRFAAANRRLITFGFLAAFSSSFGQTYFIGIFGPEIQAELYGIHHLGAIRSMVAAVGVSGTALGPVTMGSLIDRGLTIEQVCLLFSGYSIFGTVLMFAAFRRGPDGPDIRNDHAS